jgi:sulfate adenylyltransferase subunit 1
VAGGVFRKGDEVMVLPSGFTSKVKSIDVFEEELDEAFPPMSVTLRLEDEIDISRGDMIVKKNNVPQNSQDIDVMMCWMTDKPLQLNGKYAVKHTTKDARCMIKDITYKVDVNKLEKDYEDKSIQMNDIAKISLKTTAPLFFDSYRNNRNTGSVILIDEATNETVAAGMII